MALQRIQRPWRVSLAFQALMVLGGFGVLWLSWGWVSSHLATAAVYQLLEQKADYQVRRYDAQLVAQVHMSGPWQGAVTQGAQILQDYLAGDNSGAGGSVQGEHMAFAGTPMVQAKDDEWIVSVALPSQYTQQSLPRPTDPRVSIKEWPERVMAVVSFGGWADPDVNAKIQTHLAESLARDRHTIAGSSIVVPYQAFGVPGPLRRNELLIPIR